MMLYFILVLLPAFIIESHSYILSNQINYDTSKLLMAALKFIQIDYFWNSAHFCSYKLRHQRLPKLRIELSVSSGFITINQPLQLNP